MNLHTVSADRQLWWSFFQAPIKPSDCILQKATEEICVSVCVSVCFCVFVFYLFVCVFVDVFVSLSNLRKEFS